MKKLLIDCSFISTTNLNTGIQRVVRQVLENIYGICELSEYEVMEVVLENGILREISQNNNKSELDGNIKTKKGDVLLLLDSSWHLDTWASVMYVKSTGAMVIGVIYDLIPISHPQYCDEVLVKLFNEWFNQAIELIDAFITISKTVENDLKKYLENKYPDKVKSKFFDHFLLGSDFKSKKSDIQTIEINKSLISLYKKQNKSIYLIVCTLEPRKNHKYLLDVFDILWENNIDVTLNIVGKIGWKVDDLMLRIYNHKYYNTKLFHFGNLNDEELTYCYKNSKMLLFPSFIEGFGLPIIESLNNKLAVLASDIPIHREVGSQRIGYFDLQNKNDLVSQISKFEETGISESLQVPADFRWINWNESTELLFEKIKKFDKKFKPTKIKNLKKNKKSFKQSIKKIPILGWFLRWSYNLLRLNNIKHSVYIHQTLINTQQSQLKQQQILIDKLELKLTKRELEIISLQSSIDTKIAKQISYQSVSFQQRIDQFIFDTKIELKNEKL
ncbi:MAG: hypothetical protein COB17_04035 [Sulfurimonas sp.]|nr:MAG: hypothetical protein COB17_04035 [Sulfurimonas sp.]